ncbi:hypothetical protein [Qipengyuania marisflavi]|uniref:Uncharacterized protein n=1 Tax=Qipengyuania marisflavi TaxID=2486356 RepID=A0A5S3P224_9SPHN|nr:hypothetical protein [Qipengyuania marisflavi]TMM46699.1 hypothetical protein FEV51_10730 [Qipengyuania marisflavi]
MSTINQISRGRAGFLLLLGIAFAAWQLTEFHHVQEKLSGSAFSMIGPMALTLLTLAVVALLTPIFARPRMSTEDELTRQNRRRAFTWGYCLMIGANLIALFVASNTTVPAHDLLRAMLIVGLSLPIIGFALMERAVPDDE